jgi:hypothetical protein
MVVKIFRGSKAADIPVEQPTKFELVINLKAAKAIGVDVSASLYRRRSWHAPTRRSNRTRLSAAQALAVTMVPQHFARAWSRASGVLDGPNRHPRILIPPDPRSGIRQILDLCSCVFAGPDPSVLFNGKDVCLSILQNLCSCILRGPRSLDLCTCIFLGRPILKVFQQGSR